MRDVVLTMQVSLDGYVADPDGGLEWAFANIDDEVTAFLAERLAEMDTMLMGRVNYLAQAAKWPTADGEIAAIVNQHRKIVFSSTLPAVEWQNSRLATGSPADEIAELKRQPGGVIGVAGGATFAQALLRDSLIDRVRLSIQPVALGKGVPLFAELRLLSLLDSRTFGTGVVVNTYAVPA